MRFLSALITLAAAGPTGYMLIKKNMENNPDSQFTKKVVRIAEICKKADPYIAAGYQDSRTIGDLVLHREPKYARLLKEAQEVLGVSEASDEFDEINKLRMKNKAAREEITELKKKRPLVPKKSWLPFVTTQETIKSDIERLDKEIIDNKVMIAELRTKILAIFQQNQLSLTDKELEYFLISAEGDDLLTLMSIAHNMKRLQSMIEQELASDPNNVQLAKSYTGMYLVSLDAYGHAHQAAIANIHNYRSKLDDIFLEAENNYNEGIRLKAVGDSQDKAHIDANLALNKKTLEIVQLYDGLLERRIENLQISQASVQQKVSVARNTYKTLANGSMLINLVSSASNEYSLLVNFEMPELKSIYDTGLLTAFMDISERIKEES